MQLSDRANPTHANRDLEAEAEEQAGRIVEQFRKENPGIEQYAAGFRSDSVYTGLFEKWLMSVCPGCLM